jgi:hypothetical protein
MKYTQQQIFTLIFFALLLPMLAFYYSQTEYPYSNGLLPAILGVAGISITVVLLLRYRENNLDRNKQEAVAHKIKSLRDAGQELHVDRTDVLTKLDIDVLSKYIANTLVLVTVIFSILGLAFLIFGEGILARAIGLGLLVAIYPLRKHMQKEIVRVIEKGEKQIVRGIITDRTTTTTGSRDDRTTNYWLTLGEIKLLVTRSKYDYYQIGDAAEFHTVEYPKGTTFVLRDEKLDRAGLQ